MKEYNPAVERCHAEKVKKVGKKIILVSQWKGKRTLRLCQKLRPKKRGKGFTECRKPITHVVSWNIDRWYGKRHTEDGFCEEHAKETVISLKKGYTLNDGTKMVNDPINIRKL